MTMQTSSLNFFRMDDFWTDTRSDTSSSRDEQSPLDSGEIVNESDADDLFQYPHFESIPKDFRGDPVSFSTSLVASNTACNEALQSSVTRVDQKAQTVFATALPFTSEFWNDMQIQFVQDKAEPEEIAKTVNYWKHFLDAYQILFPGKTAKQLAALWERHLDPSVVHGPITKEGKKCIRDEYLEVLKKAGFNREKIPRGTVVNIARKLRIESGRVQKFITVDRELKAMTASKGNDLGVDRGTEQTKKIDKKVNDISFQRKEVRSRLFSPEQIKFVQQHVTQEEIDKTSNFWSKFVKEHKEQFADRNRKQLFELWRMQLSPSVSRRRLTREDKEKVIQDYLTVWVENDYKIPYGALASIARKHKLQDNQVRGVIFAAKEEIKNQQKILTQS